MLIEEKCRVTCVAPSPICFFFCWSCKTWLEKKIQKKIKWGGCQCGPSTSNCTVLLKVLCIFLINGMLWVIGPRGQIWIPYHQRAGLGRCWPFIAGYQQRCPRCPTTLPTPSLWPNSFCQNLPRLPPLFSTGESLDPCSCGVTRRQLGSAEWVKLLAEVWLHETKFEAW